MMNATKDEIEQWFRSLQEQICNTMAEADGTGTFIEDLWTREEGGGGKTRIITQGTVIEKGGVLFSAVHGETPEKIQKALGFGSTDFYATGVSIVMHPVSPMVPIIHMNTRYFEMSNGARWFGGGIDLTPHYVNKEDAQYFHKELKKVCDQHDVAYYNNFKNWADDYFFIKHRKETRGIGGIFFDKLSAEKDDDMNRIFDFVRDIGKLFAPLYTSLMNKGKNLAYGTHEKKWQALRRGRYAEFNLVYDKGTRFGLDTNGRTESILMSMPPLAVWEYNHQTLKNSREHDTLQYLRKGIDWL